MALGAGLSCGGRAFGRVRPRPCAVHAQHGLTRRVDALQLHLQPGTRSPAASRARTRPSRSHTSPLALILLHPHSPAYLPAPTRGVHALTCVVSTHSHVWCPRTHMRPAVFTHALPHSHAPSRTLCSHTLPTNACTLPCMHLSGAA
eukprot:6180158-Pleurochrysis_carterae.AAC.3